MKQKFCWMKPIKKNDTHITNDSRNLKFVVSWVKALMNTYGFVIRHDDEIIWHQWRACKSLHSAEFTLHAMVDGLWNDYKPWSIWSSLCTTMIHSKASTFHFKFHKKCDNLWIWRIKGPYHLSPWSPHRTFQLGTPHVPSRNRISVSRMKIPHS